MEEQAEQEEHLIDSGDLRRNLAASEEQVRRASDKEIREAAEILDKERRDTKELRGALGSLKNAGLLFRALLAVSFLVPIVVTVIIYVTQKYTDSPLSLPNYWKYKPKTWLWYTLGMPFINMMLILLIQRFRARMAQLLLFVLVVCLNLVAGIAFTYQFTKDDFVVSGSAPATETLWRPVKDNTRSPNAIYILQGDIQVFPGKFSQRNINVACWNREIEKLLGDPDFPDNITNLSADEKKELSIANRAYFVNPGDCTQDAGDGRFFFSNSIVRYNYMFPPRPTGDDYTMKVPTHECLGNHDYDKACPDVLKRHAGYNFVYNTPIFNQNPYDFITKRNEHKTDVILRDDEGNYVADFGGLKTIFVNLMPYKGSLLCGKTSKSPAFAKMAIEKYAPSHPWILVSHFVDVTGDGAGTETPEDRQDFFDLVSKHRETCQGIIYGHYHVSTPMTTATYQKQNGDALPFIIPAAPAYFFRIGPDENQMAAINEHMELSESNTPLNEYCGSDAFAAKIFSTTLGVFVADQNKSIYINVRKSGEKYETFPMKIQNADEPSSGIDRGDNAEPGEEEEEKEPPPKEGEGEEEEEKEPPPKEGEGEDEEEKEPPKAEEKNNMEAIVAISIGAVCAVIAVSIGIEQKHKTSSNN